MHEKTFQKTFHTCNGLVDLFYSECVIITKLKIIVMLFFVSEFHISKKDLWI